MNCKVCKGKMKESFAFLNEWAMGVPDFEGNTILSRGQTIARNGIAKKVKVMKCVKCGHSFIPPKEA